MYTFCVLIEVIVYPLQVASEVLSYHRQVMPTELKEYLERPLDEFNNYDIDKYVQKFMYIYCRKKVNSCIHLGLTWTHWLCLSMSSLIW